MWIISIHDRFHIQTQLKDRNTTLTVFLSSVHCGFLFVIYVFYPEYIIKVLSDGYVFIFVFF